MGTERCDSESDGRAEEIAGALVAEGVSARIVSGPGVLDGVMAFCELCYLQGLR
jgi:hypothetical protein